MLKAIALCSTLLLVACSTVQTSGIAQPVAASLNQERVELRVRTGNEQMDHLVYELAYQQFADVLPLREKGPFTSSLELTFASATQGAFLGTSSTRSTGTAVGQGWYTGSSYQGNASVTGTSTTISSGTVFEWQNSTMLAVLKHDDGERIWSADYNYKGGWEMSGWVVNTPEEAARLVIKRLKTRFIADRDLKH